MQAVAEVAPEMADPVCVPRERDRSREHPNSAKYKKLCVCVPGVCGKPLAAWAAGSSVRGAEGLACAGRSRFQPVPAAFTGSCGAGHS